MPTYDKRKKEVSNLLPVNIALAVGDSLGRLGHRVYQALPHPFATFANFVEGAGSKSEPWLDREMKLSEQHEDHESPDCKDQSQP